MPDALAVALMALATWRLSVLLVRERGPWDLALRLRARAGILHDDAGTPYAWPEGMPGAALGCTWCTSLWLTPAVMLAWWWLPLTVTGVAVAALAALIDVAAGRMQRDG